MAFNWDQYQQAPTTGGITGMPTIDPSQLSMVPSGINGMPVPLTDPSGASVKFDPFQAAPSSPMQGGGGINPTTGVSAAAVSGGGSLTPDSFNAAWQASPYPGTVDGLKQFYAAHPEYAAAGITLGGSKGDKVYGPGGAYWGDFVIGAGTPGGGTGKGGPSAGGGSASGGPLSGSSMGSLGYSYGSSMAPWNEQFSAPTQEQALNTPGVQFGLEEANRMMQNSAAAKGTLLNGRFQQALAASNIGNAMQQYGDVSNRGLNEYLLKRDNFYQNQDRPFNKSLSLAQLGKPS